MTAKQRLFVAVWPPAALVESIVSALPALDGARRVPAPNVHVTLRFLGDVDPGRATDGLAGAPLRPARACVEAQLELLGRTAIALPVTGLDQLATDVWAATAGVAAAGASPFRGHLTVARLARGATIPVLGPLTVPAPSMEFDVDQVALVASTLTAHSASYRTLVSFATGAR